MDISWCVPRCDRHCLVPIRHPGVRTPVLLCSHHSTVPSISNGPMCSCLRHWRNEMLSRKTIPEDVTHKPFHSTSRQHGTLQLKTEDWTFMFKSPAHTRVFVEDTLPFATVETGFTFANGMDIQTCSFKMVGKINQLPRPFPGWSLLRKMNF